MQQIYNDTRILEELRKRLGNTYKVSPVFDPVKTTTCEKIEISKVSGKNSNMCLIVNASVIHGMIAEGNSIDSIVDALILQIEDRIFNSDFNIKKLNGYDTCKDSLYAELINRHINCELLHDLPAIQFLDDFAIVVRYCINKQGESRSSVLITNKIIEKWNVSADELIKSAIANTRKLFGVKIETIPDVLRSMGVLEQTDTVEYKNMPRMWVVSNELRARGAICALFDDVLQSISTVEDSDLFIIFSSIHEILVLPWVNKEDLAEFTKMNQEVNSTQVSADEVLGTHAYYYSRETGFQEH